MGYYINVAGRPKEEWLREFAIPLDEPEFPTEPEYALICLVDNGMFTSAAVAYCRGEVREFTQENDARPKKWFLALRQDLKDVVPNFDEIEWEVA